MMLRVVPSVSLGLTVAAVAPATAQNIPVQRLDKPVAEYAEPLSRVDGVRELRDGRVIVADSRERLVQLIDFVAGTATKIGREGSGPGEYRNPRGLYPLPGDSTLLFDGVNARYLRIDPAGKPVGNFNLDLGGGGSVGGAMRVFVRAPKGVDARGRIYLQGAGARLHQSGSSDGRDSAAIVRYAGPGSVDTIGFTKLPPTNTKVSEMPNGGRMVMSSIANPFVPQNDWAVAPDGRIALVDATDYRVTWVAPGGGRTQGPRIEYEPVRVTDADKQPRRDADGPRVSVNVGSPGGRPARAVTPSLPAPADWPEFKPPFVANSAVIAPNGELWIERSRAASDEVRRYDVFDGRGALARRVVLPPRSRLVGFGVGSAYVVRIDEDDLEYLQRFKI